MQLQELKRRLRERGRRVTSLRLKLWRILERESHLGAGELYLRAKQDNPSLSLSTVYRCLKAFKETGLIDELHFNEEHHHYEGKATEHHHLICLKCGAVIEFSSPYINLLKKEINTQSGFKLTSAQIALLGYCPKCQ